MNRAVMYLLCTVSLIPTVLFAQEYAPAHYRTKINPITPDSGITNGYVLFNGHFIKPPYEVTSNDKCVKINNVVVYGSEKPIKHKKKSERELLENECYDKARKAYLDHITRDNQDRTGAIDDALLIFKSSKLYGTAYFDTTSGDIVVTDKLGKIYLDEFFCAEPTQDPLANKLVVKQTPAEVMAKQAKRFLSELIKNQAIIIIVSNGRTETIRNKNDIYEIKSILSRKTTIKEKYDLIGEKLFRSDDIYFIIYNFTEKEWVLE